MGDRLGRTEARCMVAALHLAARGERLTFRGIAAEAGYRSVGRVTRAVQRLLAEGLLAQEEGTQGTLRPSVAVVVPRRGEGERRA